MQKFLNYLSSKPKLTLLLRKIVEVNFYEQKKLIKKYFSCFENDRILDLGCGSGEFAQLFSDDVYTGLDIEEMNIEYAKKRFPKKDFVVGDATKLPFSDGAFSKVLIVGVLHHLTTEQVSEVLKEVRRILRPRGEAFILEDTKSRHPLTEALHAVDRGAFIRSFDEWKKIFGGWEMKKSETFMNGICFYSMFLLTKEDAPQ